MKIKSTLDKKQISFFIKDTYSGSINDPLSLNLYTYCANNPLIYIDPTGNTYVPLGVPSEYVLKHKDSVWKYNMLQTTAPEPYKPDWGQLLKETISEMASDAWNSTKNMFTGLFSRKKRNLAVNEPKVNWFDRNEEAWDAFYESEDPRIAYKIQQEISEGTRNDAIQASKESASIVVGFTPIDIYKDTADFIAGKDTFTEQPMNRFVLGAMIFTPEIIDKGLRQTAKNAVQESTEAGVKKTVKNGDAGVGNNTEVFYRTMSEKHYNKMLKTGKVPATGETFISPTEAYASGYDGVLVKIEVKPGTQSFLEKIGVKNDSPITNFTYPEMKNVTTVKNWNKNNALFKGEGLKGNKGIGEPQINIGLGKGDALDTFNNNIIKFERIDK